MKHYSPLQHFTINGAINGKRMINAKPRTLSEHIAVLEKAASLLGLPAFCEATGPRIDANTARAYTSAHRWFIDCQHPDGGIISSYHIMDHITEVRTEEWDAIRGATLDEFLAGDFDTHRWDPNFGETLRIYPMPVNQETVAAYAEFVMSAGGVFEIRDLKVNVA